MCDENCKSHDGHGGGQNLFKHQCGLVVVVNTLRNRTTAATPYCCVLRMYGTKETTTTTATVPHLAAK